MVRAELARRRHGKDQSRSTVYAAITAERFTGLFVLLVLALGALALTPAAWQRGALIGLAGAGVAFASAVMAAVASRRVGRFAARLGQRFTPLAGPAAKLQRFQADLWAYADHRGALFNALLQSLAFYAVGAASVALAAMCFGLPVDAHLAWTGGADPALPRRDLEHHRLPPGHPTDEKHPARGRAKHHTQN